MFLIGLWSPYCWTSVFWRVMRFFQWGWGFPMWISKEFKVIFQEGLVVNDFFCKVLQCTTGQGIKGGGGNQFISTGGEHYGRWGKTTFPRGFWDKYFYISRWVNKWSIEVLDRRILNVIAYWRCLEKIMNVVLSLFQVRRLLMSKTCKSDSKSGLTFSHLNLLWPFKCERTGG